MAYIPPAVHQRNRAFVRPSGDASAGFTIDNMPPGGRVFLDGVVLSDEGGTWSGSTWRIPSMNGGNVLRVVSPAGDARETDQTELGGFLPGAAFDYATMTPVAGAPTALRILNGPIGGGTLWIDGQPVAPLPATPAWNGHSVNWPAGQVAVRIQTPAGEVRTAVVTVPSNLDFNAMTVMTRPIVLGLGLGGTSTATLTITGVPSSASGLTVRVDGRILTAPIVGGTWVAPSPGPSDAATIEVQTYEGAPDGTVTSVGPMLSRVVAIPSGDMTIPFSTFAPPAPATGTLTLMGGQAGWTYIIAPSSATTPTLLAEAVAAGLTRSGPVVAGNTVVAPPLPLGSYSLLLGRPDSMGGGTAPVRNVVVTAAPAVDIISNAFPSSAPTTGQLTVTGVPGWIVAIALPGSTVPLTPPATIPASGGITVPAPVGSYDLAVNDGARPIQVRRITVTAAGRTVDTRSFFDASPAATNGNLTVTGTAGWMLTLTPTGSSVFVNRLPILANGRVTFPVVPGSYSLKVEDGAGHTASQSIEVPAGGRSVDVGPWLASQVRATQGPTTADPAKGTVRLSGAPPQAVVTIAAAGLSYTVDATGRPVALDVLPGTYALNVTPVGGARRAQSVVVVAGQTVEVTYGAMPTPSSVEIDQVQPVELMCGPVLNRAALPWAPATACPGNELTAPDGTRWRALAATGGVTLAQLRADGTPAPAGMGLGTKVMIVGVVAAAGYAGWMWYSNRKPSKGEKQENPSKSKCSCGG